MGIVCLLSSVWPDLKFGVTFHEKKYWLRSEFHLLINDQLEPCIGSHPIAKLLEIVRNNLKLLAFYTHNPWVRKLKHNWWTVTRVGNIFCGRKSWNHLLKLNPLERNWSFKDPCVFKIWNYFVKKACKSFAIVYVRNLKRYQQCSMELQLFSKLSLQLEVYIDSPSRYRSIYYVLTWKLEIFICSDSLPFLCFFSLLPLVLYFYVWFANTN